MIDTDATRKEWPNVPSEDRIYAEAAQTITALCDEIDQLRERDELAQKVMEAVARLKGTCWIECRVPSEPTDPTNKPSKCLHENTVPFGNTLICSDCQRSFGL